MPEEQREKGQRTWDEQERLEDNGGMQRRKNDHGGGFYVDVLGEGFTSYARQRDRQATSQTLQRR